VTRRREEGNIRTFGLTSGRRMIEYGDMKTVVDDFRSFLRHAPEDGEYELRSHEQLAEAGKILGLRVVDYLIVARKGYFSFLESGLIR
jgi:hypothetical protein